MDKKQFLILLLGIVMVKSDESTSFGFNLSVIEYRRLVSFLKSINLKVTVIFFRCSHNSCNNTVICKKLLSNINWQSNGSTQQTGNSNQRGYWLRHTLCVCCERENWRSYSKEFLIIKCSFIVTLLNFCISRFIKTISLNLTLSALPSLSHLSF